MRRSDTCRAEQPYSRKVQQPRWTDPTVSDRTIVDLKLEKLLAQVAGQRIEPLRVCAVLGQLDTQLAVHLAHPFPRVKP
jgi:hypothetical protein